MHPVDPRRRPGPALALGGLLILVVVLLGAEQPVEFGERVERLEGDRVALFVARGPAAGEYDAANDTTIVVFSCSHGSCSVAVRVPGDVRNRLGSTHFLLEPLDEEAPFASEPLGRRVNASVGLTAPGQEPERVTKSHYELRSVWPRALLTTLGTYLLAAGGIVHGSAAGSRARSWWFVTASMGLVIGMLFGFVGPLLFLLGGYVLLPPAAAGTLLTLWPRSRPAGIGLLVLVGMVFLTALALMPLFPAGPEL